MHPYHTGIGQLVLALCLVAFGVLLVWCRQLNRPQRIPRLLAPDGPIRARGGAVMNPLVAVAMLAGAVVGVGVFIIVRGFVPARPALSFALDSLHPAPARPTVGRAAVAPSERPDRRSCDRRWRSCG